MSNGQVTNYSRYAALNLATKTPRQGSPMYTVGDQQDLADVMRCKVVTIIHLEQADCLKSEPM